MATKKVSSHTSYQASKAYTGRPSNRPATRQNQIEESFLAFKLVLPGGMGYYQNSFHYGSMMTDHEWHSVTEDPIGLHTDNAILYRNRRGRQLRLCNWGWHALPLSRVDTEWPRSYASDEQLWLVEMFGDVVWSMNKFCTSEMRFVTRITRTEWGKVEKVVPRRDPFSTRPSAVLWLEAAKVLKLKGKVLLSMEGQPPSPVFGDL